MKRSALTLSLALLITLLPHHSLAFDLEIWDRLEGKNPRGYVLLIRHALAPGVGDPANFTLGDCSTQRNLSDEGRRDARDIGEWLKLRNIKINRVETSRWCRARETAELLGLGRVRANKNLDSLFEDDDPANDPQTEIIRNQIIEHRSKRGLLIMVGHFVNIGLLTGESVDSGEGVLVRATQRGVLKVVGRSPKP
ncbi:MAG: histidine phosphatase family protein [Candidatus Nanopelagicaceae bacterium]|jgi:phosphohistidine phosphatase SixA